MKLKKIQEEKTEIGGGLTDLISLIFRMGLYKDLMTRYRNGKIHFVTLEMDEDRLKERIHNQFIKKLIK